MAVSISLPGKLVSGSFFTALVGIIPLLVKLFPSLETIKYFDSAYYFYSTFVRGPFAALLGIDVHSSFAFSIVFDTLIIWISLFLAINAFIYSEEPNFLWGHIKKNYCYNEKDGLATSVTKVLPKFLYAFIMTPIVCTQSIYYTLTTGNAWLTKSYITINLKKLAYFTLWLFVVAGAALFVLTQFVV